MQQAGEYIELGAPLTPPAVFLGHNFLCHTGILLRLV